MPLRNVATTFTIEQQRLEINALAGDVNNISTGTITVGNATTATALAAGATGADLTLSGTLTVNGTQTILNTATLEVEDKNIILGKGSTTDAAASGGGITLKGANDKTISYSQTGDKWVSNIDVEIVGELEVQSIVEAVSFFGDGSQLTDLTAANLIGALPAIDGSALTGIAAGATIADAGNANANRTILFSANASGSNQTLNTDGGILYNAAEDALKVNGTIITAGGITGAGGSCVVAAANHSSTCSITVGSAITMAGEVSDSKGKIRSVPANEPGNANYQLVASDAGKYIDSQGTGNTITVPQNTFSKGDVVTIVRATSGDVTIAQGSGVTMYHSADGANSTTGDRTLGQRGMATMIFVNANYCYISGAGLS